MWSVILCTRNKTQTIAESRDTGRKHSANGTPRIPGFLQRFGSMSGMSRRFSYVVGVDDAPFERDHRGDVAVIGAVFNGSRLEGVLSGQVRRDGRNATSRVARMIEASRFADSLQAVLLQGITLAGFNVVDLHELNARLGLPVIAVCRRPPDLDEIRRALLEVVAGGKRKWRMIERVEPPRSAATSTRRASASRGRKPSR